MSAPLDRRVAVVFLVDAAGRVLLQLRDAHAPVSPNQWSVPGGGLEPGEEPEAAACRELLEETGLRVARPLALFWHGMRPSSSRSGWFTEWYVYSAPIAARQEDVVLGEGAAMEFVAPDRALTLNLGASAAHFLPLFLASPAYRRLCGGAST